MLTRTVNSRIIKAPRDKVWEAIVDMENWPNWDPTAKNRIVYHHILEKKDNYVICEEIEQVFGLFKGRHIDKYILTPKVKLEETILRGYISGSLDLAFSDRPEGTHVTANTEIKAKALWLKIVYFFLGERFLHQFMDEFLGQLASYVESG